MPLLELRGIEAGYGKTPVLRDVSLGVDEGELVALIGPNGAGKTTTLRVISGLLRARSGTIVLDGREITGWPTHRIVAAGIGHCPEGRQLFPQMTVLETLVVGACARRVPRHEEADRIFSLFPLLHERRHQRAGSLSGGEQQMLAIARTLMGLPRVFLVDEPSLGLAPGVVEQVGRAIQELSREGMTVLLVEQNAVMAFGIASRGYVLENGRVAFAGTVDALRSQDRVREAYLGV